MPEGKCAVCGKKVWVGITKHGDWCRICRKWCCPDLLRDGLCPYCWEKRTGKKWR